jgi:superoxide dismutase, Cu-Zn family
MKKTDSIVFVASLALSLVGGGCGGSDSDSDSDEMIAGSDDAALMVYDDPYAPDMAGTPNPVSKSATASAEAFDVDGKLRIELTVEGFPAGRAFGSHLHKLPCDDPMKAGGHYQHMPLPAGGTAMDPAYANATNEAWLDFTTDAMGNAESVVTMNWIPRPGEANAIIIHHMLTGTGGGAGAKLACLPMSGF